MKPGSPLLLLAAAFLAAVPAAGAAQAPPPPAAARVWFTGASNVRPFTCRATQVVASETLPSVQARDSAPSPVTLRIPVAGLDCGIGMMNRHLHHALHADLDPDIRFTLAQYELVPGDSGWTVRMSGRLSVAGVERPEQIDGVVALDSADVAHVRGTHELRVTDYGVEPPRRFLGLLRVRERVTVHFDVPLAAAPEPTSVAQVQRR